MTLSVVVLSLKVCPDMSFCPRVPLKQTSLGSRRSSILSEVKGRGCHFDDTPLLTSSLSSLTCTKLTVFAKNLAQTDQDPAKVVNYCSRKLFILFCCYVAIVW